jgi:hypothetical protein
MQPRIVVLRWTRNIAPPFLSLVLLLVTALGATAQSGRKPPKQPKSPDPIPSKQEEPPVTPPSEQNSKPQIPVKVVWHLQSIAASTIYTRIVQDGCLERLSESGAVKTSAGADLNRKEAIDIAKGSADTYVLYFELEADVVDTERTGIGSIPPQYFYVRYEIFTPGTGKPKAGGHVYQRSRGPGGMPLPGPGPQTTSSAEYSLRYAGSEMADRLLDALGLPHPVRH